MLMNCGRKPKSKSKSGNGGSNSGRSKSRMKSWISREGPEGDCVLVGDATITGRSKIFEELFLQKQSFGKSSSSESTYKGYHTNMNISDSDDLEMPQLSLSCKESYPLEVALPAKPDGKREIEFIREGMIDVSTQTKEEEPVIVIETPELEPVLEEVPASNMSIVSAAPSDKQEWSYTLYDFEGQGRGVSKEELANLVRSIYEVLGKSVDKAKKHSREPLDKVLKVQLSVSKDRKKDPLSTGLENQHSSRAGQGCRHYRARQKYLTQTKLEHHGAHLDSKIYEVHSPWYPREQTTSAPQSRKHGKDCACTKCEQRKLEKTLLKRQNELFPYPKRTQTYPGQCYPDNENKKSSNSKNNNNDTEEKNRTENVEKSEHVHHHKSEMKSRHKQRRHHHCGRHTDQEKYAQYLDLAIDPIFEKNYCKDTCHRPGCLYYQTPADPCGHDSHHRCRHHSQHHYKGMQPVEQVIRHEHHHHHSHHHYYHHK